MKNKKSMKVGARNSTKDMERLQQAHDLLVENGAMCKGMEKNAKDYAAKYAEALGMTPDQYAAQECGDVMDAANVLSQLALLAMGETYSDEPKEVKQLCKLMRGLLDFIKGEIDEIESNGGNETEETAAGEPETVPLAKSRIAVPSYIKALHLPYDAQRFQDVLAVKFVSKNEIKGYSNLWGNPDTVDLETEYFTSKTDFWDKVLGLPRPLTWNHAQDGKQMHFKGNAVIGDIESFGDDEIGRFYTAVLDRSHEYHRAVSKLIGERVLGTSSDSAPQYVVREKQKNGSIWLKQWPLFAAALTDVPCEPRMLDIGAPDWKALGVDAKLLQSKIAEAGLETPRDKDLLETVTRRANLLRLYVD